MLQYQVMTLHFFLASEMKNLRLTYLGVEEARHPEALGATGAEPLGQLLVTRQEPRPPAAQRGRPPGALEPRARDARHEERVQRLVQALAQRNRPCDALQGVQETLQSPMCL